MKVNPLVKLGNICLSFLTNTLVTSFLVIDTALEISQRLYCVLLLDKKKRQEIFQDGQIQILSGKKFKSIRSEEDLVKLTCRDDSAMQNLRKSRSWDSKLVGLAGLGAQNQFHTDGEAAVLISYRSSISSDTCVTNDVIQQSSTSSPASESSELQSQGDSSQQISYFRASFRHSLNNSFSVYSRINEDEETERYIEDLQNQVSQLMYQTSVVQQLQQRVEDLEKQRDLLTKELLETPKDIVAENEMLKAQLQALTLTTNTQTTY
eukprot:TRINITY_DN20190_c0_g1_i1.p1 TRINITY_DN20190_c0_g1~~TRINITY_DN20190_c0_g1_i1.p1  ORF type:complete len:287 (+),score=14.13 TRINITY_DN20190_c0_g1_i1:71-862(+)